MLDHEPIDNRSQVEDRITELAAVNRRRAWEWTIFRVMAGIIQAQEQPDPVRHREVLESTAHDIATSNNQFVQAMLTGLWRRMGMILDEDVEDELGSDNLDYKDGDIDISPEFHAKMH